MVLRLVFIGLLGSSVLVLLAVMAGEWVETDTLIRYHVREEQTYVISIKDMVRDVRIGLAGTRCYNPLPPWFSETEEAEGIGSVYQTMNVYISRVIDDLPAVAVERLRCR